MLLDKPRYEYVKEQVRRKMFRWQVRHVIVNLMKKVKEAVLAETFADGMQILVEEFGEDMILRLPNLMEHYMRLREAAGDEEVIVVRLFRRMMNRKKFCAAVDGAITRRKRLAVLAATREEMRVFLQPLVGWVVAQVELEIDRPMTFERHIVSTNK